MAFGSIIRTIGLNPLFFRVTACFQSSFVKVQILTGSILLSKLFCHDEEPLLRIVRIDSEPYALNATRKILNPKPCRASPRPEKKFAQTLKYFHYSSNNQKWDPKTPCGRLVGESWLTGLLDLRPLSLNFHQMSVNLSHLKTLPKECLFVRGTLNPHTPSSS